MDGVREELVQEQVVQGWVLIEGGLDVAEESRPSSSNEKKKNDELAIELLPTPIHWSKKTKRYEVRYIGALWLLIEKINMLDLYRYITDETVRASLSSGTYG